MLCYKDKTFCSWSGTCANVDCPRWVDISIVQQQDLPLAMADYKSPDCGYKPNPVFNAVQRAVKGERGDE